MRTRVGAGPGSEPRVALARGVLSTLPEPKAAPKPSPGERCLSYCTDRTEPSPQSGRSRVGPPQGCQGLPGAPWFSHPQQAGVGGGERPQAQQPPRCRQLTRPVAGPVMPRMHRTVHRSTCTSEPGRHTHGFARGDCERRQESVTLGPQGPCPARHSPTGAPQPPSRQSPGTVAFFLLRAVPLKWGAEWGEGWGRPCASGARRSKSRSSIIVVTGDIPSPQLCTSPRGLLEAGGAGGEWGGQPGPPAWLAQGSLPPLPGPHVAWPDPASEAFPAIVPRPAQEAATREGPPGQAGWGTSWLRVQLASGGPGWWPWQQHGHPDWGDPRACALPAELLPGLGGPCPRAHWALMGRTD